MPRKPPHVEPHKAPIGEHTESVSGMPARAHIDIPVGIETRLGFNIHLKRGPDRITLPTGHGEERFITVPELVSLGGKDAVYYRMGEMAYLILDLFLFFAMAECI